MKQIATILVCCFLLAESVFASKILVLYLMGSKSHKNFAIPIVEELADRGHEITFVSPYKTKTDSPRLRDIVIETDYSKIMKQGGVEYNRFEERENGGVWKQIQMFLSTNSFMTTIGTIALETKEVRDLFDQEFDIVLMSGAFNDLGLGIAHKVNAPVIQLVPAASMPWIYGIAGNPSMPSFVPNIMCPFTENMTFSERIVNVITNHVFLAFRDLLYFPGMEKLWKKYDPTSPSLYDLQMNTSLILTNGHVSISGARPYLPNIVEVGGAHCKKANPLPKDLEEFVSGSGDDGFILFSFGSVVNGSMMPEKYRLSFVNAFSKLKQRVLWKWETEKMEGLPSNVKLGKWLPQQDILGHPKIKAFITHGGLLSTLEATYHGVPLIGVPFFGDQDVNLKISEKQGYAIKLELEDITEEVVTDALNKVLTDSSFRENVQRKSSQFKDQYPSPLDRAIYWIEYVIRHKGAHHLKSIGATLPWYQYHSLDVYAFLIAILLTVILVVFYIVKCLVKLIRCLFKKSDSSSSNKKKQ